MVENLLGLIIAVSALFVFYDTTKNKIGKIPDEKGFLNLSPGLWAVAILLLWIVAFPLYLINRSKLIQKAQQSPQETPDKKRKIGLGILGTLAVLVLIGCIASIGEHKSNIEISAQGLVTEIIQEEFLSNAECVNVKLGEEFAKNNYHAIATLNNGNTLKITIQVKEEDDQIFVQIPHDQ